MLTTSHLLLTLLVITSRQKPTALYCSSRPCRFGPSISVTPYVDEFYTDPKSAVKKLTKAITEALIKLTINAGDW